MRTLKQWSLAVVPIAALAAISTLWAQSPPASPSPRPKVDQVVIVFKTHFDIGYTDMASNVVKRYRTSMIDEALKVVDLNSNLPPARQFAWTLAGWPLSQIMADWPGQTPERQARLRRAFQSGRFVVHALPFTTHTELLEVEDLVRGLGFSSRLSRAAALELPRDAKMTDVPCHSWIMPTLLRHAGVDFLHLGCNAASRSPEVPRLFWWEGADGSRLLTMYTAESYGTGLVPPADWPYRTWLALIHTGDNHGPPTPDEVKKLLAEAEQKLPGVKVRIGRLSDFADGILAEQAAIPVVRGDMPDSWIHGPMCDPRGAQLARGGRPFISVAEALNTELRAWGVALPDAAPTIAAAYEQSLLYGEHTWGGALYWVTKYSGGAKWGYDAQWKADQAAGRFQRLEDSWAEHTAYIETASRLVSPLMEGQMKVLASQVKGQGRGVVVFNPLPWRRDGVVRVKVEANAFPTGLLVSGQRIAWSASEDETLSFVAREVPPLGYVALTSGNRTSVPSPQVRADAAAGTIENEYFKIALDPARGAIRSLVDKRTGRELANASAAHGFGQYLYERFDSNQVAAYVKAYVKINTDWAITELGKPNLPPADRVPYRAATPKNCRLSYEDTLLSAAATMQSTASAELPHAVTTKVIVYAGQPYVDLAVTVHAKPADAWPEAGWLCLPFQVESPLFRLGRQASIVDPARNLVRGANRHLYGVNTGVAVFDAAGRGVGLCPLDTPLVSLDEPGCWKYTMDFVPRRPNVYLNLFNNQWTTNFRLWNQGTWTYRVRLWAFEHFDAETCLITPSLEARFPLQAVTAELNGGRMPAEQSGLELSRKGVQVMAFGANPDGAGTVLRLWEVAGQTGTCQVRLPSGMETASVQPIDLRGRPLGPPLAVRKNTFETPLRPFAPASFLIPKP